MDWVGRGLAWGGGQLRRAASVPSPPAAAAALTLTNARTTARSRARPHARTHTQKRPPPHMHEHKHARPIVARRAQPQSRAPRPRRPSPGGPGRDKVPSSGLVRAGPGRAVRARNLHRRRRGQRGRSPARTVTQSGQGPQCRPLSGWEGGGAPDWRAPFRHTSEPFHIYKILFIFIRSLGPVSGPASN